MQHTFNNFCNDTLHLVRCPNCGSIAERSLIDHKLMKTECHACDYLLISCQATGRVIESYAPGIISRTVPMARITPNSGYEYWREAIAPVS